MENSLLTTLSQQQTLSLDQQQSLRILQMPTIELLGEIDWMLEENPFLDKEDSASTEGREPSSSQTEDQDETVDTPVEAPIDVPYETWQSAPSDDSPFEHIAADTSFRDELHSDLACLAISPRLRVLADCLIEELDDRGFINTPIEELSSLYAPILQEHDLLDVSLLEWEKALAILQTMDPPGIGTTGPIQSLQQQIQRCKTEGVISETEANILDRIATQGLSYVAANNLTGLKKLLKCDEDVLNLALNQLKRLNPYPISRESKTLYIVPDVVVETRNGVHRTVLNPALNPHLRLRSTTDIQKLKQQFPSSWQSLKSEAKSFIQGIEARHQTLLRLANKLLVHQKAFFDEGLTAIRPLTISQIAQELELSVPTVSRAVSGKFIACRHGTIEMRTLFSTVSYATATQPEQSATQIQALIVQLIETENPRQPFSDDDLCLQLQAKGITIARRTVAKYRTNAGIPSARARKHF